jgi:hypothetical protein
MATPMNRRAKCAHRAKASTFEVGSRLGSRCDQGVGQVQHWRVHRSFSSRGVAADGGGSCEGACAEAEHGTMNAGIGVVSLEPGRNASRLDLCFEEITMKIVVPLVAGVCFATSSILVVQAHADSQATTTAASAPMTAAEHAAEAERYAQEATELRAKSEQHAKTAKMHATRRGPRDISQKLQHHCERLAADYAAAAKEAEELASLHRDLAAAGN